MLEAISPNLWCHTGTCRSYILRRDDSAVLIDFGDGEVLSALAELGIRRVSDILITHHHRDQCQGLPAHLPAGARVWVPETEAELFTRQGLSSMARARWINYDMRQSRFSLLQPLEAVEILPDYAALVLNGFEIEVLPTPGHTVGSLTLLVRIDGRRVAFCGDLIAGPGKIWSLAAAQWTYNGAEGLPLTAASLRSLIDHDPDLLLPSHGECMSQPREAAAETIRRLTQLIANRKQNPRLVPFLNQPFRALSPHLLFNQSSEANSYVLLSEFGAALLVDFGYDFICGQAPGADRSARRPWLYSLPYLKRDWGVQRVEVALPTHYHDDHVAGLNLLRRVEGTQVWAAHNFAPILQNPGAYDLPCLWPEPIPVDRTLPLGEEIHWREYTFTLYPLPGHTRYAAAVFIEVDGMRVLFSGDQFRESDNLLWNYTYQSRVRPMDFAECARLFAELRPDLILSGHDEPFEPEAGYFEQLSASAHHLSGLQSALLPVEGGAEGVEASLQPYQARFTAGQPLVVALVIENPAGAALQVQASLALPQGWRAVPACFQGQVPALGRTDFSLMLYPPASSPPCAARAAADLTVNGQRLGQVCDMLLQPV